MCGKANVGAMHVKRIGTDVNNDIVLFTLAARHVVVQWRNCVDLIAVHAWACCMSRVCGTRNRQEFALRLSVIFLRRHHQPPTPSPSPPPALSQQWVTISGDEIVFFHARNTSFVMISNGTVEKRCPRVIKRYTSHTSARPSAWVHQPWNIIELSRKM